MLRTAHRGLQGHEKGNCRGHERHWYGNCSFFTHKLLPFLGGTMPWLPHLTKPSKPLRRPARRPRKESRRPKQAPRTWRTRPRKERRRPGTKCKKPAARSRTRPECLWGALIKATLPARGSVASFLLIDLS